jgi:hypothetical protein
MTELLEDRPADPSANRWKFMRDVAVFEAKLTLNNLHNMFQVPLTFAVAVFDILFKGKEEGGRFYKLVEVGRTIDDQIDIYSVISHRERRVNEDLTVDAIVARLETIIVREYEKGRSAAAVKQAVDSAIDATRAQTSTHTRKAADMAKAAIDRLYEKRRKPRPDDIDI